MSSTFQVTPYLREQRNFPTQDIQFLQVEVDKAYIDIAQKVNARVIGTYPTGNNVVTGEIWYLKGSSQKQQALRQVYTFTSTSNIPHGLTFTQIERFTLMYGSYSNGSSWFGLIPGSNTAIAGQISFYLTSTNIVFETGSGAPSLTSGTIVLQWLSYP